MQTPFLSSKGSSETDAQGRCSPQGRRGEREPHGLLLQEVRAGFSAGGVDLRLLLAGQEFEERGEKEQSKPWRRWRKEARDTGRGPSLQEQLWKPVWVLGGFRRREGCSGKVGG